MVFEKKGFLTDDESLDFFFVNFANGDILLSVYRRLQAEGIYARVFGNSSFLSFIAMFVKLNTVTYMPIIRGPGGELKECCGILWVERTHDVPLTGRCHFIFFKRFWGHISREASKMCIHDAFQNQGFELLIGITPVQQRMAINATRKLGFSTVGILPKSVVFLGEVCDSVILYLHKENFHG